MARMREKAPTSLDHNLEEIQALFPFGSNSRLEVGDPLFTSPADGPDLKLIQLQLTGLDNYSTWARDFHRVLITKDKEGFSRRIRALPNR